MHVDVMCQASVKSTNRMNDEGEDASCIGLEGTKIHPQ